MVREAKESDIPRIAEIIVFGKRVAYRPIFQNDYGSFQEIQVCSLAKDLEDHPGRWETMLVYDDGIVKGVMNRQVNGKEMRIFDFYVEPFFKGQGVGQTMLSFVIEEARRLRASHIGLLVLTENVRARHFYEKNGFVNTCEKVPVEGTDQWDFYYELTLC